MSAIAGGHPIVAFASDVLGFALLARQLAPRPCYPAPCRYKRLFLWPSFLLVPGRRPSTFPRET